MSESITQEQEPWDGDWWVGLTMMVSLWVLGITVMIAIAVGAYCG